MKNLLIIIIVITITPSFALAQRDSIPSGIYHWKTPTQKIQKNIYSATLFDGSVRDMEYVQMTANTILQTKDKSEFGVPDNEEQLIFIKKGILSIGIKDSTWSVVAGSMALLMPGEKYSLQNTTKDSVQYYVIKYRSKQAANKSRGIVSGGSLVKDWNKIKFTPNERGGGRKYFERPTAMCKRLEMHATTLKEGIRSHAPHTHRAEEMVLVLDNKVEIQIGDKSYKGSAGDVYYLGSYMLHGTQNDSKGLCTYLAFQFE